MTWKADISVWLEKPSVIQVFSDDGQEQDYVPERTCEDVAIEGEWFECSKCGTVKRLIRPNFCPICGSKVVR